MLDTLITSKTRIKLLLKFFLNSNNTSYLRDLEGEFRESTNAIRMELNRFEKAGLLTSLFSGNKKIFRANTMHPLFQDIHNILLKYTGIDHVIAQVIKNTGGVFTAFLVGEIARGNNSQFIDLLLVSDHLDRDYLAKLIIKAEKLMNRKIRCTILSKEEYISQSANYPEALLLWNSNNGED